MGLIKYAVLNDIHFPYEGPAYYKAFDMMKQTPNLSGIYLNGDICEIESVSSHPKGPAAHRLLMAELEQINVKFDTIQNAFQYVPVRYLEGNHEFRIYRYLRDVSPELWGLISCPKIFKFDNRPHWTFHQYGPTQLEKIGRTKDLYCRHEPLVGGQFHAKGTAEKSVVSMIYGHTHVYQQFTHKKFGPTPYSVTALSNGWLGDINQECFNYRGARDNWQSGFSMIECDEKSGDYEVRFYPL